MLSRRAAICSAIAMTFAATVPAVAHDAPRVETEVVTSDDTTLEVTHVLQLSTTQRLLYKAGIIETNDLSGLKARAQLALYTAERFELIADGETVPLNLLGAEIEGGHVYVYQTGEIAALPETWSARNAILRDLNPHFDNTINVPTSDGIRTIVFENSDLDAINSTS
ncbi:DUF6702 family protein [Litorimonas sp. WD9-15]|uniref:DUF6702 family protein n=1 Tax=Litorimonas sp. WD9-15 TaxID=3418716 RepID=UPI003CFD0979